MWLIQAELAYGMYTQYTPEYFSCIYYPYPIVPCMCDEVIYSATEAIGRCLNAHTTKAKWDAPDGRSH